METFTADQIVGKTLVAIANTVGYYDYPGSSKKFNIYNGQNVGKVFSFVSKNTPDGKLYWMLRDSNDKVYYVQHDPTKMQMNILDASRTTSLESQIEKEKENKEIDEKGKLVYYAEKWGKPVLFVSALFAIGKLASIFKN